MAVIAMIAAIENEESRRILRLAMILQEWKSNPSEGANRGQLADDELDYVEYFIDTAQLQPESLQPIREFKQPHQGGNLDGACN